MVLKCPDCIGGFKVMDVYGFDEEGCQYCSRYGYQKYINSPEWKNKSFDFKWKNQGICSVCGHDVGIAHLQTHHKKYPADFKDDNEFNWIAVCADCHNKIHGVES